MVSQLYKINGNKLTLDLHPGQTRVWDSPKRFIFMLAGSQSGKTSFGPWWLWREIMQRGEGDYLAVTATFDLFKLKMLPEMRKVFEHILKIGRYWAGDGVLEIADPTTRQFWAQRADDPMWARVILRSAASDGGLESATGKAAWLDECGLDSFGIDTWEAVQARLTLNQGRVLGTTTPYNLGWLKTQIVDRRHEPTIEVVQFDSTLNPNFAPEEFERLRASMPEYRFNMRYRGLLGRPAGLIYNDFIDEYEDQGGHKVKPFKIPAHWVCYVGVDPGAVHQAMIWIAHDTERNRYYVYRESLEGGKSTAQHAKGAQHLAHTLGENVRLFFVGQKAEVQQRLDWIEAGVRNVREPSVHDVQSGIDRVIELLKRHRLFFFDDCTGILDEIARYKRKVNDAGEVQEEIEDKATFHRADALRYGVVGVTTPQGVGFG